MKKELLSEIINEETIRKAAEGGSLLQSIQMIVWDYMAQPKLNRDGIAMAEKIADLFEKPMGASQWRKHGKRYGYYDYFINDVLQKYNSMLCKLGYTDSDVYAEEPTAIERFLTDEKI